MVYTCSLRNSVKRRFSSLKPVRTTQQDTVSNKTKTKSRYGPSVDTYSYPSGARLCPASPLECLDHHQLATQWRQTTICNGGPRSVFSWVKNSGIWDDCCRSQLLVYSGALGILLGVRNGVPSLCFPSGLLHTR